MSPLISEEGSPANWPTLMPATVVFGLKVKVIPSLITGIALKMVPAPRVLLVRVCANASITKISLVVSKGRVTVLSEAMALAIN